MQRRASAGTGGALAGLPPSALLRPFSLGRGALCHATTCRATCHKRERTALSSRERLQQRLRLLEVGGVKALGEPAIDCRQQFVRLGALALLLPQAAQAHGGAQLPGLGLLAAGNGQGLVETDFGLGG